MLLKNGCLLSTTAPASRLGKDVSEHGEAWLTERKELLRVREVHLPSFRMHFIPLSLHNSVHIHYPISCVSVCAPGSYIPPALSIVGDRGRHGLSWREREQVDVACLEGNHQLQCWAIYSQLPSKAFLVHGCLPLTSSRI